MKKYDVIIVGAGAAGLRAAASALANGRNVAVFDMGEQPARKVAVSGGGRCNFTNMAASRDRYTSENPDFVRGAIATIKPTDILQWMDSHKLKYVEKSPGQYFCETGADDVVRALIADTHGADIFFNTPITSIEKNENEFTVSISHADNSPSLAKGWTRQRLARRSLGEGWDGVVEFFTKSVIIATGGMSYPNLGVSDIGHKIAKKFGHKIVPIKPGLVALKTNVFDSELSGLSLNVEVQIALPRFPSCGGVAAGRGGLTKVKDSLLFTHFGIGGPAAYRASLYNIENGISVNFAPDIDAFEWLKAAREKHAKKSLSSVLSLLLPARLAKWFVDNSPPVEGWRKAPGRVIADYSNTNLKIIADEINRFEIPAGAITRMPLTVAEVTSGGVSTDMVSSKTMESKLVSGLFFAGEVLDVTGDLGGFNLHFAFASGTIAGRFA